MLPGKEFNAYKSKTVENRVKTKKAKNRQTLLQNLPPTVDAPTAGGRSRVSIRSGGQKPTVDGRLPIPQTVGSGNFGRNC